MTNEDLGYNSVYENNRKKLGLSDFSVARVISEYKEAYRVKNSNGEFLAKITGKQIFNASSRSDYPAVGDWVAITELGDQAVINAILPRLTIIERRYGDKNKQGEKTDKQIIATNIDYAFVIESVDRDFNLNRFERYFSLLENGGVLPVIILNKIDLISKEELNEKVFQLKERFPNIDIISTSIINSEGLAELKNYLLKNKTYCFLGSSGVGKSSLINKLLGESIIKTSDISSYSDRGKHTTTNRQMYFLDNGAIVIDNPGIREVGLTDVEGGVSSFFDEITSLSQKCKYSDCTHTNEPGCKILEAIECGDLDEEKYSNYLNLKKETEYYNMTDKEKRDKERQFGKMINKIKKSLKNSDL